MALGEHLKEITRRASFISHKFYAVRNVKDLRMSVGLFKIMVQPLYRLAYTVYAR